MALNKLGNLFSKKSKPNNLAPEDLDVLLEQSKILSGQIRGILNDRAREVNTELICSVLMDVAQTYYQQGLEDARKSEEPIP